MAWTEQQIQGVWEKGTPVNGNDPKVWRKDACGAWIARGQYGNRDNQYGWEIDHISPNGGDGFGNLQPLQWENNVVKSDGRNACAVRADGVNNRRVA